MQTEKFIGKAGKKVASATKHVKEEFQLIQQQELKSKSNVGSQERIIPNTNRHHIPITTTQDNIEGQDTKHKAGSVSSSSSSVGGEESTLFSTGSLSTEVILTIYTAILSTYHACTYKSEIMSNQWPLSVVFPLLVVAFLLGYTLDRVLALVVQEEEKETEEEKAVEHNNKVQRRMSKLSIQQRRGGMYVVPKNNTEENDNDVDQQNTSYFSRTRHYLRRKKQHIIKQYVNPYGDGQLKSNGKPSKRAAFASTVSDMATNNQLFFTNLSPLKKDVKEFENKLIAPFTEGPLMDHLLSYSDFTRHKSKRKRVSVIKEGVTIGVDEEEEEVTVEELEEEEIRVSLGNAKLHNTRAESLESYEKYSNIIDPMCELRGMDLFLTDDPEESIWRSPILNECGLRDCPTFIANMMMPFGNMCAYFKLPAWLTNFGTDIAEKDHDPPDVKALKRFLAGNNEYRNARCKVIPYVVDGPLAIRLIKPKPLEVSVDGPRHPSTWENVPQSFNRATGKTNHAIVEVDIDLLSEKTIRKVINIVRPHIESITCDLALIISAPKGSEIPEPSCCLGLWRIDKVDFMKAAVIPDKTLDEAAAELTQIMSVMVNRPVEVVVKS